MVVGKAGYCTCCGLHSRLGEQLKRLACMKHNASAQVSGKPARGSRLCRQHANPIRIGNQQPNKLAEPANKQQAEPAVRAAACSPALGVGLGAREELVGQAALSGGGRASESGQVQNEGRRGAAAQMSDTNGRIDQSSNVLIEAAGRHP